MLQTIKKIFITDFEFFQNKKYLEIFILGIISGIPLVLIYSTFTAWLKDSSLPIEIITTIAIARLPYSLKFLWAPIIDNINLPLLSKFGHRKSWLILCTALTSLFLYIFSLIEPNNNILYLLAILLAIVSASYDINVDAFRIENFLTKHQTKASTLSVLGYRIGMLIAGAGALEISYLSNWQTAFIVLSIIFIIATIYIFFIDEQDIKTKNLINSPKWLDNISAPFKELLSRKNAIIIFLMIIFFKMGDAMLAVTSIPFYLEVGFNKQQIALIAKIWGVFAMLIGSYTANILLDKLGVMKGLLITCVIQALTHLAFVWLYFQRSHNLALFISITIENLGAGIGSTALIIYLSMLCHKKYSATQYALLSSASSLCSSTITIWAGALVKYMGWVNYFFFTIILALPGFFLLLYIYYKLPNHILCENATDKNI